MSDPGLETPPNARGRLTKESIASLEAQYKDQIETWKLVETKTQGLIVLDGIAVSACIALVARAEGTQLAPYQVYCIVIAFAALVSMTLGLFVLIPRALLAPPLGIWFSEQADDIEDQSLDQFDVLANALFKSTKEAWVQANRSLHAANSRKSHLLFIGQVISASGLLVGLLGAIFQ